MPVSNITRYERIARFYDLLDLPFERTRYRALRPLLFRDLSGRLLDDEDRLAETQQFIEQRRRELAEVAPFQIHRRVC